MRIQTGILGLDDLLGGGYRQNTVNVVLGSTGTGKTIFALQYLLKGIEKGEKAIFISFDMDELDIVDAVSGLGWTNVKEYIQNNQLIINKFYVENITYLNDDLFNFIESAADENTRIAIDSFTPLVSSISYDDRNDVNWFFSNLRKIGTTVLTLEEPPDGNLDNPSVVIPMFLASSVVNLKSLGYGEAFNRTIRILKHRGSWHEEGVFPYKILKEFGILIEGTEETYTSENKVDIDAILSDYDLSRDDIEKDMLDRMDRLAESNTKGVEGAINDIVKKVKKQEQYDKRYI
ncbi:MAG: ATPase domain-containing protein [Archaeoglobaceae archaeon]